VRSRALEQILPLTRRSRASDHEYALCRLPVRAGLPARLSAHAHYCRRPELGRRNGDVACSPDNSETAFMVIGHAKRCTEFPTVIEHDIDLECSRMRVAMVRDHARRRKSHTEPCGGWCREKDAVGRAFSGDARVDPQQPPVSEKRVPKGSGVADCACLRVEAGHRNIRPEKDKTSMEASKCGNIADVIRSLVLQREHCQTIQITTSFAGTVQDHGKFTGTAETRLYWAMSFDIDCPSYEPIHFLHMRTAESRCFRSCASALILAQLNAPQA